MDERVTITGERETMRRIAELERDVLTSLRSVVKDEAEEIIAAAQSVVPAESGTLAASFFVSSTIRRGHHSALATCGYEAPYAAADHEGFHGGHRQAAPPPKWLEHAASGRAGPFAERVAAAVETRLEAAGSP